MRPPTFSFYDGWLFPLFFSEQVFLHSLVLFFLNSLRYARVSPCATPIGLPPCRQCTPGSPRYSSFFGEGLFLGPGNSEDPSLPAFPFYTISGLTLPFSQRPSSCFDSMTVILFCIHFGTYPPPNTFSFPFRQVQHFPLRPLSKPPTTQTVSYLSIIVLQPPSPRGLPLFLGGLFFLANRIRRLPLSSLEKTGPSPELSLIPSSLFLTFPPEYSSKLETISPFLGPGFLPPRRTLFLRRHFGLCRDFTPAAFLWNASPSLTDQRS